MIDVRELIDIDLHMRCLLILLCCVCGYGREYKIKGIRYKTVVLLIRCSDATTGVYEHDLTLLLDNQEVVKRDFR